MAGNARWAVPGQVPNPDTHYMKMYETNNEYGLGGSPGLANTTGNKRLKTYSSLENGLNLPPRDLTTQSTTELRLTRRQEAQLQGQHLSAAASRLAFQAGLLSMPSAQVYVPVSMDDPSHYPKARRLEAPTLGKVRALPSIAEEKKAKNIQGYLRRKALKMRVFFSRAHSALAECSPSKQTESAVKGVEHCSNKFQPLTDELELSGSAGEEVDNATPTSPTQSDDRWSVVKRVKNVRSLKALTETEEVDDCIPQQKPADYVDIPLPSFNKARAMRDKKSRRSYVALTYYLKTKHFMHIKDPHHIRTLVQDARAWMIKNNFQMETFLEYCILTSAVAAAFFVDQEELAFRARMKNSREWQALYKHNNACQGDLGYKFGGVEARFKTLRHLGKTNVHLPVTQLSP